MRRRVTTSSLLKKLGKGWEATLSLSLTETIIHNFKEILESIERGRSDIAKQIMNDLVVKYRLEQEVLIEELKYFKDSGKLIRNFDLVNR